MRRPSPLTLTLKARLYIVEQGEAVPRGRLVPPEWEISPQENRGLDFKARGGPDRGAVGSTKQGGVGSPLWTMEAERLSVSVGVVESVIGVSCS